MTDSAALDLVTRFCAAWEQGNLDELGALMTDDAVYHNIPFRPSVGRAAFMKEFQDILDQFGQPRFEIQRAAAEGNLVFNERIDHLTIKGNDFALPVVGVFEVRDGKIAAWRDYFDAGKLRKALAAQ